MDRKEEEVHVLHTEPSFAIYSNEGDDKFAEDVMKQEIGPSGEAEFSFGQNPMGIIEEDGEEEEMLMMIRGNPGSPLALRSYAQYLQSKGDFSGAEEYYSRATMADPEDGETLSQYATFMWEVRADRVKASDYFQRAAVVAPDDSNVLAAYASFLWNIDDDDDEEEKDLSNSENIVHANQSKKQRPSSPPLHLAMGLGIHPAEEDHYCRMIEEDPCNPLFLRNYANFLHQSKGDLDGAEEYYSRAIQADPSHGQTYSLYADVVWQLHRDKHRAAANFERAIQADPDDSNLLATYAKFLWEADDDSNAHQVTE